MPDQHIHEKFGKDALFTLLSETEKLTNVGGWEWDIINDNWTFSDNWLRIHGFSKHHLATAELLKIAHPDDRTRIQKAFNRAVSEGANYEIEHRIIHQNTGEERYIKSHGKAILDSDGKTVKVYGAAHDITELRQTEKELRKSEEKIESLVNNLPGVAYQFLMDKEGAFRFEYMGDNSIKLFGVKSNEVLKDANLIFDLIPQPDADEIQKKIITSAETLTPYDIEHRVIKKNGEMVWVHAISTPQRHSNGDIVWNGIGLDITRRKRAEEALEKKTRLLKRITENMFDLVSLSDLDGNYTFAGKSHERILGYATSDLIGKNVMDFVHPDDLPRVTREFKEFLMAGGRKTVGYRYKHKKGHYRWFETIGEVLRDESDAPSEIIYSTRDITEHRRIEHQVKISEQKFRGLAENVPGLVLKYKLNPDGSDELLYISKSVEEIFEISQEDAFKSNKLLWDRIHEDDLEAYAESIKISAENLSLWEQEHRIQLPGGRVKWLFARGTPAQEDDGSILWDTIALDITEQKRVEALLKENEQRYKSAQRMGNVGNWEYDLVTETFWGSDQAKRIYGFDPENDRFTTEDVENCIPERERVHQSLIDLIENDIPYTLEFDIHPISGPKIRTVRSIAEVLRDDSGVPLKVVGVIQDITEQKKSLEQKERLEKELIQSQKMESIGTLAGGVAHEFNNILSIIIGNNELVMEDLPEWSLSLENCKEIHSAGLRARDIVRHLLTFSRHDVSTPKPINVKSVVKESLKLIRVTTPKNIEIKDYISPQCLPVFGDATQINQIMINLCNNAVDALPISGGRIDIQLGNTDIENPPVFSSSGLKPGKYVELQVRDNGVGMDKEILDRIFEPYFTTKDVGKGSGIGLAVVHGIVKKHGGSIVCDSTKGQGTVFTILIPAYDGPVKEETNKNNLRSGKGEKILYVDDEPSIANLGRRHLESMGYDAHSTTDPAEALKMIKAEPERFDLVITDMAMPNMPGDQLVSEILAVSPGMPTVICTGYSSRMSETKALEMGIKAFVMKPLNKTELSETVRQILNRKE